MLIELIVTWTVTGDGGGGSVAHASGIAFDTDSKTVGPYSASRNQAILDPKPFDVHLPAGTLIWFECAGFTQTRWFFDGTDSTYTDTVENSADCGWTPPAQPAPTCDLVLSVTVQERMVTALVVGAHGNVTYSSDGGTTRQASNVFGPLPPGSYVITAYDDGPTDCYRSQPAYITAAAPGTALPELAELPALGFSRNQLALVVTATQPGRALLVELWVETTHGSLRYERVVQRLRPTGATGQAVLQLQDQLHAVLAPQLPDLEDGGYLGQLALPIRRYYAGVAEVQPATSVPGNFVYGPVSTVLLGGLPWVQARSKNFFYPLPDAFLTWRQFRLPQVVGKGGLVLLARLVTANAETATAQVYCYQLGQTEPFTTLTYQCRLSVGRGGDGPKVGIKVPVKGGSSPGKGGTGPGRGDAPVDSSPYLVQLALPVDELPAGTFRFEVEVLAGGTPQPSRARYRLDADKPYYHYVFLNSLGQWEALSCPGPLTSKTSAERTVATTLVPADYDPQDGPDSVVNVAVTSTMTVSTGLVGEAERAFLRELLTSRYVYEVNGQLLRKIRLTTKDLLDYQDNAGADGLAFEYAYCFDTSLFDHDRITHL